MPPPTNTDATTAIDLGTLPATVTQDVFFSGTTYSVWYSFTSTQTGVVGYLGLGPSAFDGTVYQPRTNSYIGPAASPVLYPVNQNTNVNRATYFPVTSGVTYYLNITPFNSALGVDAPLTLEVEYFSPTTAPVGSIVIPDDTDGYPLALLSKTTGAPLQYVQGIASGEQGVSEPSMGSVLIDDNTAFLFKLYTSSLTYTGKSLAHPTAQGTIGDPDLYISYGWTSHDFYVGWISDDVAHTMTLKRVSPSDLTVLQSWTIANVTNLRACAPNVAETVLYISGKAGTSGSTISKYDLVGNVFLTDFAATIANYVSDDILVLPDDTVVISYFKASVTRDEILKTYNAAGTVLQSKSYGSDVAPITPSRLGYALDSPTSFWFYHKRSDTTGHFSTFHNVKTSDLSDIAPTPFNRFDFDFGSSEQNPSVTPQRYGSAESCPIFILRGQSATTQTFLLRRQRRFLLPSSENNYTMQIPIIELLIRTGIGLKPDVWGSDTPYGTEPMVRFRISKDGGKTWGPERHEPAGRLGEFLDRVRLLQATGNYRNAVLEVTVDAPVDWQWIAALGNPVEGSS